MQGGKRITVGHVLDGTLYRVNTPEFAQLSEASNIPSSKVWRGRLGHFNHDYVN